MLQLPVLKISFQNNVQKTPSQLPKSTINHKLEKCEESFFQTLHHINYDGKLHPIIPSPN